jgi:formate dehydrogenase iron-sulfur subunit
MITGNGRSTRSPIPSEFKDVAGLVSLLKKEPPPPEQTAMGFFTDTSLCIGCKACEVACKQWNQLPATEPEWTGTSYDNTKQLSPTTWRHVQFIEQFERPMPQQATTSGTALPFFNTERWLMQSDVCKHCKHAPCQEACPTGAIIRTEFDTVYVQQDICNGCGYCVVACPFDVIARDNEGDGQAHKCTLCYDRLKDGIEPACAKACPTDSIQFGPVEELRKHARERVGELHKRGVAEAQLYGEDEKILEGGLNSFFLLLDQPEIYNLPSNPPRPSKHVLPASLRVIATAIAMGLMGIFFMKKEQ